MSIMDQALRAAAAECDAKDLRIRELESLLLRVQAEGYDPLWQIAVDIAAAFTESK